MNTPHLLSSSQDGRESSLKSLRPSLALLNAPRSSRTLPDFPRVFMVLMIFSRTHQEASGSVAKAILKHSISPQDHPRSCQTIQKTLPEFPTHVLPKRTGPSWTLLVEAVQAPQQDSGVQDDLCPGWRAFCPTEPHLNEKEANRASEAERNSTKTRGSRDPGGIRGVRGARATGPQWDNQPLMALIYYTCLKTPNIV